jgi:hypothetical protein
MPPKNDHGEVEAADNVKAEAIALDKDQVSTALRTRAAKPLFIGSIPIAASSHNFNHATT